MPDVTIAESGSLHFDPSKRVHCLSPLMSPNKDDMPILGLTFLTSAYLISNHERGEFSLWQANPTTTENIIPLDGSAPLEGSATCNSSLPEKPSATTKQDQNPPDGRKMLTSGVVTGIVIPVLCAAAFTIVFAGLALRQRKRRRLRHQQDAQVAQRYMEEQQAYESQHRDSLTKIHELEELRQPQEVGEPVRHEARG